MILIMERSVIIEIMNGVNELNKQEENVLLFDRKQKVSPPN